MTKKAKSIRTTEEVIAEKKIAESETELPKMNAEAADTPADAGTFVYCGPSIRGIARQYTVFKEGLPEHIVKFTEKHPIMKSLIVPLEQYADMRRKLETKGTAEALLYGKLKSEL